MWVAIVYRWLIEINGGSARNHEYGLLVLCPSVTLKHLQLQTSNCEPPLRRTVPFDIHAVIRQYFLISWQLYGKYISVLLNQKKKRNKNFKTTLPTIQIPTLVVSLTRSQISLYSPKEFTFKSKYRFWYLVVKLLLNWKWLLNLHAFVIFSLAINLRNKTHLYLSSSQV